MTSDVADNGIVPMPNTDTEKLKGNYLLVDFSEGVGGHAVTVCGYDASSQR
jgi:C1A family cysteine protease